MYKPRVMFRSVYGAFVAVLSAAFAVFDAIGRLMFNSPREAFERVASVASVALFVAVILVRTVRHDAVVAYRRASHVLTRFWSAGLPSPSGT